MNAKLEERLRKLNWDDILDWVPERTARRGEGYRDRVGEIVETDDCLAAKVRGTEEYTTNLFADAYGELASVCSCPVGRNCKHGVALALCASDRLKAGESFTKVPPEGWRLDREADGNDVSGNRQQQGEEARRKREEDERKRSEAEARAAAEVSATKAEIAQYDTCYAVFPDLWEAPGHEYDKREVWLDVAERLTSQLDSLPPDEADGGTFSIYSHRLPYIRTAYRRAGCEELAIPVYRKHIARTELWKDAIDLAMSCGKPDVAIEFAKRGFREMDPNCYPEQYDLLALTADAFAAKGDFGHAAAILAEVFLSWGGAYLTNRTVESFHRIIDMAAKAGVGKEVRVALIHALETGDNPLPLQYWKYSPPKQEYPWRPVPKPVVYRSPWASSEPPTWPLPPSDMGIRLDKKRWKESKDACQDDQEFLVRLALAEEDRAEVARRFCALPAFPHTDWPRLHPEIKELIDAVRSKMIGYRPDLVEVIDRPELHWTWRKKQKGLPCDIERGIPPCSCS